MSPGERKSTLMAASWLHHVLNVDLGELDASSTLTRILEKLQIARLHPLIVPLRTLGFQWPYLLAAESPCLTTNFPVTASVMVNHLGRKNESEVMVTNRQYISHFTYLLCWKSRSLCGLVGITGMKTNQNCMVSTTQQHFWPSNYCAHPIMSDLPPPGYTRLCFKCQIQVPTLVKVLQMLTPQSKCVSLPFPGWSYISCL